MLGQEVIVARGLAAGVDVSVVKQIARDLTLHHTSINRLLCKMVANSHMVLGDTAYWCELSLEYEQARLAMDTALELAMDTVIERNGAARSNAQNSRRVPTKQSIIHALQLNLANVTSLSRSTSPRSSSLGSSPATSSPSCGMSPHSEQVLIWPRSVPVSPRDRAPDEHDRNKVRDRKKHVSLPHSAVQTKDFIPSTRSVTG
jgi:hypothetical protein